MIRIAVLVVGVLLALAGTAAGATLKVTSLSDGARACTLREAIAATNSPGVANGCGRAARRSNTIVLRSGRYKLTIPPSALDDDSTGDLDVTGTGRLLIIGAGAAATVIDATGLGDRVLSIAKGAHVTLTGLTITGGHPAAAASGSPGAGGVSCSSGGAGANGAGGGGGGAVFNAGALSLDAVAVARNIAGAGAPGGAGGSPSAVTSGCAGGGGGAGGDGGGIYNVGTLSVTASTFSDNAAGAGGPAGEGGAGVPAAGAGGDGGTGGSGGAIWSAFGALSVTNSTFAGNTAGAGGAGAGGAPTGVPGSGGDGGAIDVTDGTATLLNATVARNGVGAGGPAASAQGSPGSPGSGGGLFAASSTAAQHTRLENTIVAENIGEGCVAIPGSAIADGGHDLGFGDRSCPGANANPALGKLRDNGGPTATVALGAASAAIDRVPRRGAHCPATDQRGVRRPEGRACDIGAFELAPPAIQIASPLRRGSYERGARIIARYGCSEGGIRSAIATCKGTVRTGRAIDTRTVGAKSFRVTVTDKTGKRVTTVVHYVVWAYTNPLAAINGLAAGRIDMGVDYSGSGPILALGDGRVTMASNTDSGPPSCWGITCWPGGGAVVYRLLDGPFAGKYVFDAENITVNVSAGQTIRAGQQIATLHQGYPNLEIGWEVGNGPETLAFADGHQCSCGDPGGWSAIEGRNFDSLLVRVGAPFGLPSGRRPEPEHAARVAGLEHERGRGIRPDPLALTGSAPLSSGRDPA